MATAALTAGPFISPAAAGYGSGHTRTQQAMDSAVRDGVPGVTGQVGDAYSIWPGTSGVKDLASRTPRSVVDHYRIGSMTKAFVATVEVQLAERCLHIGVEQLLRGQQLPLGARHRT
ncbi:hypothetical protein OTB20_34675 [Streptomyces sp. H27-H1]|uniref:hypothetical protein n=1 Tax=Streptomyces sp. H27-H1 TaxID=2996461 RepID=UPI00226DAD5E|nr:hypothetical protein [Streptomyces sp. H27-H1]MCY0931241.1 hypothetical protein [Streptomyces sp. H27-H1]